jgi:phage terminase small subunit
MTPNRSRWGLLVAETGRKPFATYDLTPFGFPDERLRPPASLGELEKRAFLDLIARVPAGQFRESDLSLVCRWCELTVVAERAGAELSAGNLVTDDGKVSPWVNIHEKAVKGLTSLALRLRLGPQSRADKAPKTLPTASMSYYDRMSFEEGKRDGDGEGKRD